MKGLAGVSLITLKANSFPTCDSSGRECGFSQMPPTALYSKVSQPEKFNKPPLRWLLALLGAQVHAEGGQGNGAARRELLYRSSYYDGAKLNKPVGEKKQALKSPRKTLLLIKTEKSPFFIYGSERLLHVL